MTMQVGDEFVIDGRSRYLRLYPLDAVLAHLKYRRREPVRSICSGCSRGYIATWELRDLALYLVAVSEFSVDDGTAPRIDFEFDDRGYSYHANLFEPDDEHLTPDMAQEAAAWLASDRSEPLLVRWVQAPRRVILDAGR